MVEIVYKYINEKIDEDTLVLELESLSKTDKYRDNEVLETLILNIKKIMDEHTGMYVRYDLIKNLVVNNELHKKEAEAMTDAELLDMITSYFNVPLHPQISFDYFEELVDLAISSENAKEKCFRLLTNYVGVDRHFDKIIDYFIKERDTWYLSEIICFCGKQIDTMDIVSKIVNTRDKKFIKEFLNRNGMKDILLEEEIKLLKDAS